MPHSPLIILDNLEPYLLEKIGALIADADPSTGVTRSWGDVLADRSLGEHNASIGHRHPAILGHPRSRGSGGDE